MRTQTEPTVPSKLSPDLRVQNSGTDFRLQGRRQSNSTGRNALDLALKVFAVGSHLNRRRNRICVYFQASQTEGILKKSDHSKLVRLAHERDARAE
jgi:hypothetical protein